MASEHTLEGLLRLRKQFTDKQDLHSYGPLYDAWLGPLREKPLKLLEIGVSMFGGGDLLCFADFLPRAEIHGLDNNLALVMEEVRHHPRIVLHDGDAYDPATPRKLSSIGPWDVIIDDCVHRPLEQQIAFRAFWPMVTPGGCYILEDIHQAHEHYLRAWLEHASGPDGRVECHNLTHEGPGDNIIARVVRC